MNTFWLKVAVIAVAALAIVILVNVISPSQDKPKPQPKTFYDQIEQDDKKLRAEPASKQIVEKPRPKPKFKGLSGEDKIQAEGLFEMALAGRKMGRLPGMSYKQMVDYCRQIIQGWPDSIYAAKARRLLRNIPQHHRKQYNITDEEINLSK